MTEELLLTAYQRGWNAHDHRACADCFTGDAVRELRVQNACADEDGPSAFRGRPQIAAGIEAVIRLMPDLAVEVMSVGYASDRRLWTEWRLHGTHSGARARGRTRDRRVDILGVSVFRLSNDGFTEERAYWDSAFVHGRRVGLPGLRPV